MIAATSVPAAQAQMTLLDGSIGNAFAKLAFVSPANFAESSLQAESRAALIRDFCAKIRSQYKRYKWSDDPCGNVKWQADLRSKSGHPLIYAEFGKGNDTTLLLGGVHPDELTPVHIAFRMARYLDEHPDATAQGMRVILAPLVNPDGFLRDVPTRTNANGIDLNRNFFTMDWYERAQKEWGSGNKRERMLAHFPGYFPNSEVETMFQIRMIDRYLPDKILSVHAPLGFLDYDGPGSRIVRPLSPAELKAKRLVKAVSESSRNYRIVDFTFFPGSIGNYAGNERHIPTVTLELQTTDPGKVDAYWDQFHPGLMQAIKYQYTRSEGPTWATDEGANASAFSDQYTGDGDRTI